jgi:hypothetical protein
MDDEKSRGCGAVLGGSVSHGVVEAGALIALAGMPFDRFMRLKDDLDIALWLAVAQKVMEWRQKLNEQLAQMTANAVLKGLGGK